SAAICEVSSPGEHTSARSEYTPVARAEGLRFFRIGSMERSDTAERRWPAGVTFLTISASARNAAWTSPELGNAVGCQHRIGALRKHANSSVQEDRGPRQRLRSRKRRRRRRDDL